MNELLERVLVQVRPVVVGQDETVQRLLIALACHGHVLLEGAPGVAKTLLARTVAATLGVQMRRVQFTPDMLPSDLTGTMALRGGELAFRPGPVFTNVLLADEINRTPPEDAGGAARGDAGASGDDRRTAARARPSRSS